MKNEAIEMIKMSLSVVRAAAFCLPLALVASCGSDSEAVQGTVINIRPVSVAVTSDPSGGPSPAYVQQVYRIELRSPTGYPQIGTKLVLTSGGTVYAGHPTIGTVTCTGVAPPPPVPNVCTDAALTPLTLPYEATTDSNGTFEVTMIYGFYTGADGTATVLEAFSGTGYGKTDIEFTCQDDGDAATTPNCP